MSTLAAALILGILVSTAYAAAFHFIVGGRLATIPAYLIAAWAGFAAGHFFGDFMELTWLRLGVLQLLTASIGAWIALIFIRWLVAEE